MTYEVSFSFSLNYHQQRIKYVLFYSTDRDTQEGGKNPKQPVRKSLFACMLVAWIFQPHRNKIISDPPASQRHRKREGLCVCEGFPTSIRALCQQLQVGRGNLGGCSWWGVMACTGAGQWVAWGGSGFPIPTQGCPSHGGTLGNMSFAFTVLAQNEH